MRGTLTFASLLVMTVIVTGCYHQVVRTGAAPSATVIERPWTATYLFGLVPATAINTAAECPAGVAVVETQQTWVNGLVAVVTLGIYTPQAVTITCATGTAVQGGVRIRVPADAGVRGQRAAIREAVGVAPWAGEPVFVGPGV